VIGSANNFSWYKNIDVDSLIGAANTTFDRSRRRSLYVWAQRKVMDAYVHIPGYHYIETRGVRSRVHGFSVDPMSSMPLVDPETNVWVEQK